MSGKVTEWKLRIGHIMASLYGASLSDFCVRMKLPATNSPSIAAALAAEQNHSGTTAKVSKIHLLRRLFRSSHSILHLHFTRNAQFGLTCYRSSILA